MQPTFDKINNLNKREFKSFIPSNAEEATYYEALKKVKRMKGFYTHLAVYIVINIMIIITNINNLKVGESYFQLKNFYTAFFWGIGIFAHGVSVFLPDLLLSKQWEERKIKEFMEKEKQNNQWQ
ncbi:2TM domain-containing protein [Flavobacterium sp.]|jgi:hypothetical protein|uniref:2TM domain-containing protein n=1 Tax=Flavobacterium sp. TaxID=239 RepID=UPI0037BF918F